MKVLTDRIAHWSFVGLLLAFAATSFYAPGASAHGEKSQAAFMRMRTIHWFDLHVEREGGGRRERRNRRQVPCVRGVA